mmetsp:Transcript_39575/g.63494  ORF Transcript_39575/g.63494 Transcript_39575/m.63494 type:complete len:83 (-) Transcript_39575:35-283(-)
MGKSAKSTKWMHAPTKVGLGFVDLHIFVSNQLSNGDLAVDNYKHPIADTPAAFFCDYKFCESTLARDINAQITMAIILGSYI